VPIYHIHGNKDRILPVRIIEADAIIKGGTHKMAINYSEEITRLITNYMLEIICTGEMGN
jgi:hypothetical protein